VRPRAAVVPEASLESLLDGLVRRAVREAVGEALAQLMSATPSTPRSLTIGETAEATGFSERSIRRMVADGRLRSVRSGRAVRIPAAAVDELISGS
jgi:excisionase family DNA binding protein